MIGPTNSNNANAYIATERDRVQLRNILRAKGKTVADDAPLSTLIPKTNSIGVNSILNAVVNGSTYELVDTDGEISAISNNKLAGTNITKLELSCGTIPNSAFASSLALQSVKLTSASRINDSAFNGCTALEDVVINSSGGLYLGSYAFKNCSALNSLIITGSIDTMGTQVFNHIGVEELHLPFVTTSMDSYTCSGCTNLKVFTCKGFTSSNQGFRPFAFFENCSALQLCDIGNTAKIANNTDGFKNCSNFKAFVIRKNDGVTTLAGAMFKWLTDNNITGWIVAVPYSYVDSYKVASNWSTYASYITSIQKNLANLQSFGMDISDYYEIVEELPSTDIDDTIVYLIETATEGTYEQHFYGSGSWEQLSDITLTTE